MSLIDGVFLMHLERLTLAMHYNGRTHIATFQAVFGQVTCESYGIEFFDIVHPSCFRRALEFPEHFLDRRQ